VLHCTTSITQKGVERLGTTGGPMMATPGRGYAAVFGPDGRRLTEPLDETAEGIVYAELDMDTISIAKMFADCTGHYSRPDLMWLGVNPAIKGLVREGEAHREVDSKEVS
jgi:nitrilase